MNERINPLPTEGQQNYDIYTVGLGKRSFEEFASLIPPGTTRVVDIRKYTANSHQPQFSESALRASLQEVGIQYDHMNGLSGVSRERKHLVPGKNGVVDFSKLLEEQYVQQAFNDIAVAATNGEKVLVVSGLSNPAKSERSMFFGQIIERNTPLKVGHIDTGNAGAPRIRGQEEIVKRILWQYEMEPEAYKEVQFQSDESFTCPATAKITRRETLHTDQKENRNIEGNWNYGVEVGIQEDTVAAKNGSRREIYGPTIEKNARWADLTVAFESSTNSDEARMSRRASEGRFTSVRIPAHREDLLDPENITKAATKIRDAIKKQMLIKSLAMNDMELANMDINLNVTGSDIAAISTKYLEPEVTDNELQGMSRKTMAQMSEAGLELAVSGITQEDMNAFVSAVFTEVRNNPANVELDEGNARDVGIAEIRTNGQTGASEAANIAAQELGIKTTILAPNRFHYIYDNETVAGMDIKDAASFKNRFKLGLRHEITRADEITIADANEAMERRLEDGFGVGLTSRQILTLHNLGYDNNDLMTMINLAENNEVVILSASDMLSFIENCAGYGIEGTDYLTESIISSAMVRADEMVETGKANGMYLLTVNSPLYPEAFSRMEDIESISTDVVIDKVDGVAVLQTVKKKVTDKKPAILWARGDISIADGNTVALFGNENSTDEALTAARSVGHGITESELTAVASLQDGSQSEAVQAVVDNGGRMIVLDPEGIDEQGRHSSLADDVVKKGGVVLSERGPGESVTRKDRKTEDKGRMQKLSAFLGKTALVIDSVSQDAALSPLSAAAYSAYGVCAVALKGLDNVLKHKGNKEILDKGAEPVSPAGTDIKEAVTKAVQKVNNKINALYDEAVKEEDSLRQEQEQRVIPVIRMEGEKPIVLVGDGNENLRKELEAVYGNKVIVAPMKDGQKYFDARLHRQKISQDGTISQKQGFAGYEGTQTQVPEPYKDNIYYINGKIETLETLPEKTRGIASVKTRATNRALFDRFRKGAVEIQQRFQAAAGMPEHAPIHFENALHLVVNENSVDVRLGDETVASVRYTAAGIIKVENNRPLRYDLQEHSRPWSNIFNTSMAGNDAEMIDSLLKELDTRLFSLDPREAEERVLGGREANEQIDREIEEGYRGVSEDNLNIAAIDIMEAVSAGIINEHVPVSDHDVTSMDILVHDRIAMISDIRQSTLEEQESLEKARIETINSFRTLADEIREAVRSYVPENMNEQQESFKMSAESVAALLEYKDVNLTVLSDYIKDLSKAAHEYSAPQKAVLEKAQEAHDVLKALSDIKAEMSENKIDIDDIDHSIEKYLEISENLRSGGVILNDEGLYNVGKRETKSECFTIDGQKIELFATRGVSEAQAIQALRKASELEQDPKMQAQFNEMESLLLKGRTPCEAVLTTRGLSITVHKTEEHQVNGEKVASRNSFNVVLTGNQLEGFNDTEATKRIADDMELRRKKGRTTSDSGLMKEDDHQAVSIAAAKAESDVSRKVEEREQREQAEQKAKTTVVTNPKKALPSELKGEPKYGISIAVRDGRQAYVNENMNIISKFYARLVEFGGRFGWAYNELNHLNIIAKDGREILPVWLRSIDTKNGVDNVFQVTQADGRQNLLDTNTQTLFKEGGFKEIYPFRDGWAFFRQEDGRVNYINKDMQTMFRDGVSKGKEFRDGYVQVLDDNGEILTYDKNGKMLDLNQGQGIGGPHIH